MRRRSLTLICASGLNPKAKSDIRYRSGRTHCNPAQSRPNRHNDATEAMQSLLRAHYDYDQPSRVARRLDGRRSADSEPYRMSDEHRPSGKLTRTQESYSYSAISRNTPIGTLTSNRCYAVRSAVGDSCCRRRRTTGNSCRDPADCSSFRPSSRAIRSCRRATSPEPRAEMRRTIKRGAP